MTDLGFLKYLTFEINDECQLTEIHKKCPRSWDRWGKLDHSKPVQDSEFIRFAEYCRDLGFKGEILFSWYNEPLCATDRIVSLMNSLPGFKFYLWTNGVELKGKEEILKRMNRIMVTKYPQTDMKTLNILRSSDIISPCKVLVQSEQWDERGMDVVPKFNKSITKCGRFEWELIVDYYGNLHMCSIDWSGEFKLGNIHDCSYDFLISRWNEMRERFNVPWDRQSFKDIPWICQLCTTRSPRCSQV
jgi:hypothetical protein